MFKQTNQFLIAPDVLTILLLSASGFFGIICDIYFHLGLLSISVILVFLELFTENNVLIVVFVSSLTVFSNIPSLSADARDALKGRKAS